MNMTAHVPPVRNPGPETAQAEQIMPAPLTQFELLGGRLIKLGVALQKPSSTVSELFELADACGLQLRIRVVEDRQ